jgi:heavy metal sensor kinase
MSAFFLVALALVLAGFSATLYLLARSYLHRQAEERLVAALDTLDAAVEREPDGLDWEPREHHLTLGQDAAPDQVRWAVHDAAGRLVDRSANLGPDEPLTADGASWLVLQRNVEGDGIAVLAAGKHRALGLTVRLSLAPVSATLRSLAVALAALSVGVWLLAALLGQWVARRALAPVTRMAQAARAMTPADPGQRLPSPGTGDELDDLQRAFNDLLCRLHDAFESQRRFTGDASHQLRTPLAAMLGQVEVALRRPRPSEEYREALAHVHAQALHLRQIVESLLFLARADAEACVDALEAIDLRDAVRSLAARWSGHARAADLRAELPADGPLLARTQPLLLGQLLDNLVDNAFKYSEPGTPVVLRLRRDGNVVAIDVEDGGRGIAADDLPHIFEPFYRSPESRRRGLPGVGLGLAMVQRIAVALGCDISVKSDEGVASRFTLCLPSVAGPTDEDAFPATCGASDDKSA